jgi:hypothetical protein
VAEFEDANPTLTDAMDGSDAASSTATETTPNQTETQPSSGDDAKPSPSSGDTPLSDRDGLLAAVRAVVKVQETPASTEDAATRGQDTDTDGTTGADPGTPTPDANQTEADPTDAELRKLRPETRKRFERLLGQRDEARTALERLTPELDQHRQLQGYLRENQLAPEDVNLLLGVGASLRKGDFQGFLNGVMPYVQAAQEALGLRFPPDLQQQVDDGLITEATARELTTTRFRANQAESRANDETTARTQEQQGRAIEAVRVAVADWEDGIRKRDPDYALKAVAVQRFSQAYMQERGVPRTPADAVKLVQDAYQDATAQFARARPTPRPTRQAPSGINGTSHGAAPEPRSMKDAAIMALANMRRAS